MTTSVDFTREEAVIEAFDVGSVALALVLRWLEQSGARPSGVVAMPDGHTHEFDLHAAVSGALRVARGVNRLYPELATGEPDMETVLALSAAGEPL